MSDGLFESIGKISQAKGFKRKKGKKATTREDKTMKELVNMALTPADKKRDIASLNKLKKEFKNSMEVMMGGQGLLPVKPITDGAIWSDKQVQKEIERALLPDVTTKVLKTDIAPKFLQTDQVTAEHVKRWIPRGIRSIRGKNPGYRMSGRTLENGEDKKWIKPENFFLLASNSIDTSKFMREDPDLQKEGFDVAMQIYENLLQYGRRTMKELLEDLAALQPELVSMVANGMISDHYLKIVNEMEMEPITNKPVINKEGNHIILETIELVEENERIERLKKYSRALESKQVKALGNGKRSNEKTTKDKRRDRSVQSKKNGDNKRKWKKGFGPVKYLNPPPKPKKRSRPIKKDGYTVVVESKL